MAIYEFDVKYIYYDCIEVEADSPEEARELAEAEATLYSSADWVSIEPISRDEDD